MKMNKISVLKICFILLSMTMIMTGCSDTKIENENSVKQYDNDENYDRKNQDDKDVLKVEENENNDGAIEGKYVENLSDGMKEEEGYISEIVSNDEWKIAYLNYIQNDLKNDIQNLSYGFIKDFRIQYRLIYLDEDDIPELLISDGDRGEDFQLFYLIIAYRNKKAVPVYKCVCDDGCGVEYTEGYIEKAGIIHKMESDSGDGGYYYDYFDLLRLEDTEVTAGDFYTFGIFCEDIDGKMVENKTYKKNGGTFDDNGVVISEKEYNSALAEYTNMKGYKRISDTEYLSESDLLNILDSDVKHCEPPKWKQAYIDILDREYISKYYYIPNGCKLTNDGMNLSQYDKYALAYIDEDDIPELICDKPSYYACVISYKENGIYVDDDYPMGTWGNFSSYMPKKNIIRHESYGFDENGGQEFDDYYYKFTTGEAVPENSELRSYNKWEPINCAGQYSCLEIIAEIIEWDNKTVNENTDSEDNTKDIIIISTKDGGANIRKGPGTEYDVIFPMVEDGTELTVEGTTLSTTGKEWAKVYYNNTEGWISLSQVKI